LEQAQRFFSIGQSFQLKDIDKNLVEKAAKSGFKLGDIDTDLINAYASRFDKAVTGGFGKADSRYAKMLKHRLRENAYVFASVKAHHALKLIADKKGTPEEVNFMHNRYMQAEVNQFGSASQMAGKWAEYQDKADTHYLRYRTAGDRSVRRTHERLDNITLPVNDPFWRSFFPPNGYNCRCDAVLVNKRTNQPTNRNNAEALGLEATKSDTAFRFNPGQTGQAFANQHSYVRQLGITETDIDKLNVKLQPIVKQGLDVSGFYGNAKNLKDAAKEIEFSNYEHLYIQTKDGKIVYTTIGSPDAVDLPNAHFFEAKLIHNHPSILNVPDSIKYEGISLSFEDIEIALRENFKEISVVSSQTGNIFSLSAKDNFLNTDILYCDIYYNLKYDLFTYMQKELDKMISTYGNEEIQKIYRHEIYLRFFDYLKNVVTYKKI
jgi:SPP1 gp7 family putative phage head morphogenesis protein